MTEGKEAVECTVFMHAKVYAYYTTLACNTVLDRLSSDGISTLLQFARVTLMLTLHIDIAQACSIDLVFYHVDSLSGHMNI